MSTQPAAKHDHPPEGYGVVAFGPRFLPVKWASEAGESAYRPLQSDRPLAATGEPQICANYADACEYAWLAKRNAEAMLQPALELDAPGITSKIVAAITPRRRTSGHGNAKKSRRKAS